METSVIVRVQSRSALEVIRRAIYITFQVMICTYEVTYMYTYLLLLSSLFRCDGRH